MSNFTCRYGDNINDLPDTHTMCRGPCEGMGVFPLKDDDLSDPEMQALWFEADAKEPADNGWHFVKCPSCKGTGLRPDWRSFKQTERVKQERKMTVDEAGLKADMNRMIQAWFEFPVATRPSAFVLGERISTIALQAEAGQRCPDCPSRYLNGACSDCRAV